MWPPLFPAVVVLVVSTLALLRARRDDEHLLQEWADAHGLELTPKNRPMVSWYLRTARVLRTWGAVAGAVIPSFVQLAWSGRPRVLGILEASGSGAVDGGMQPGDVAWIFIGYVVGALYAEIALVRPVDRQRPVASLVPRELADYLPRRLLWAQRGAGAAAAFGLLLVGAVSFEGPLQEPSWANVGSFAAVIAGATIGVERLQRWILHRPQPFTDPSMVAADDAIRSQAVHSLAGGGLAFLLMACSGMAAGLAASGGAVVAWTMGLLAVPPLLFALISCQYLTHRPWRVRRSGAAITSHAGGAPA